MNSIDKLIDNLNKEQKDAVLNTEGPNLIKMLARAQVKPKSLQQD